MIEFTSIECNSKSIQIVIGFLLLHCETPTSFRPRNLSPIFLKLLKKIMIFEMQASLRSTTSDLERSAFEDACFSWLSLVVFCSVVWLFLAVGFRRKSAQKSRKKLQKRIKKKRPAASELWDLRRKEGWKNDERKGKK